MADVFISYARCDIDFLRQLFDQLTTRYRAPQADWQDIPPTSDWLAEICRGVEATVDTFLFIFSLASVTSEIYTLEIEHATERKSVWCLWCGKSAHNVCEAMSSYNWVFPRKEDDSVGNRSPW